MHVKKNALKALYVSISVNEEARGDFLVRALIIKYINLNIINHNLTI